MEQSEIWLVAGGLFFAGLVKGLSGIGFSTFALPALVLVLDLSVAMALITLPVLASNVLVIATGFDCKATLTRFRRMYAALIPGSGAGAVLFAYAERGIALRLLGVMTIAYVVMAVAKPGWRLPVRHARWLEPQVGFLTGVITGMTGSQVVPLVPFIASLPLDAREQVQAINIAVTLGSILLGVALVANGAMTADLATASALGVVPAIVGASVGVRVASVLSQAAFRGLMLSVLGVMAVTLVVGRDQLARLGGPAESILAERREWQSFGKRLAGDDVPIIAAVVWRERQGAGMAAPADRRAGWIGLGAGLGVR